MNNEEKLIETFYASFNRLDYKTMQQCYHNDIVFSDPVFVQLKALKAKAMWHMLCLASKDLFVTASNIATNDRTGSCNWEAKYLFSRTGKQVHNKITAQFEFKDGKIITHTDKFDFWRWSSQALGTPGLLLGWSSIIKNKVRATASNNLEKFIAEHKEYASL